MQEYRDKLSALGIDMTKLRGSQGKLKCPNCSETRKKKSDPCLSINVTEGWYNCHNCGWKGNVKEKNIKPKKEYKIPQAINQTECSPGIVAFFAARGISQKTLIETKTRSGFSWMPQLNGTVEAIQFNYFRDGNLVNIKHRDGNKNFKLESQAELIFFGLDDIKNSDTIIIVEGEPDKLAYWEAGVFNVISVPNGASKSSTDKMEYLENCWDYFENDKIVILATDRDEPGFILREELSRRIGKDRCRKVNFKDCKDANEYLMTHGPMNLRDTVNSENLIDYPLKGVVELDEIWEDVEMVMDKGLPKGIVTEDLFDLDELISFDGSKLCVVTGVPNSGKSPLVDIIMIILAIKFGWKWGVCSMENKPLKVYIVKLAEKVIGHFIRPDRPLSKEHKEAVREFISEHFFFVEASQDDNESETLQFILDAFKGLVRKHGIKGITIDPWNKIEHQYRNGENETNYVSRALDDLIRFEQRHDLFAFLVAHPGKPNTKKKEDFIPDLYSVSGSSNFYNKPDWGITVHRNYETGLTEVYVNKCKWDHLGKRGHCALKWNPINGRLGNCFGGYDTDNWLEEKFKIVRQVPIQTEIFETPDLPPVQNTPQKKEDEFADF